MLRNLIERTGIILPNTVYNKFSDLEVIAHFQENLFSHKIRFMPGEDGVFGFYKIPRGDIVIPSLIFKPGSLDFPVGIEEIGIYEHSNKKLILESTTEKYTRKELLKIPYFIRNYRGFEADFKINQIKLK